MAYLVQIQKTDPVLFALLAQSGERDTVTVEVSGSKPLQSASQRGISTVGSTSETKIKKNVVKSKNKAGVV